MIYTKAGMDLYIMLRTFGGLLEEYSADEDNPNITSWLTQESEAMIENIEKELIKTILKNPSLIYRLNARYQIPFPPERDEGLMGDNF